MTFSTYATTDVFGLEKRRFTKPLLYQLSYVGVNRAKIAFSGEGYKGRRMSHPPLRDFDVAARDAVTTAARKSRQFRVVRCVPEFHRARLGSARSVPAMVRS